MSSVTNLDPFNGSGIYFYSVGSALVNALRAIRPGDIALIEQQFQHWDVGFICDPATDPCGNCDTPPWVAVEEYPQEHAAISMVTRAGIVVVEAAGNGRMLVTPASSVDSGAIVVGASNTALRPTCWSNFGPRVNVHGWGMNIGTTGYGGDVATGTVDPALRANGADPDQWYTTSFNGTSGASPIVVGAAAIIQSTRIEVGLPVLNSVDMRTLLATTGTPQAAGSTPNIGPLPDLRRAIATYRPDAARFVSQTAAASIMMPGATFVHSATFANSGGVAWSGAHNMSVAPSFQTGLPIFQAPTFSLGSPGSEVFPEDQVMRTFSITAPAQPGTYSLSIVLKNGFGQVLAASSALQIVVAAPNSRFDDARITIISAPGSLSAGQSALVSVTVENTGSTTWSPTAYSLGLQRGMRISLPQTTVTLPGPVSPGGVQNVSFTITWNGPGQGWFSAQMRGTTGAFGQQASRTVVCH